MKHFLGLVLLAAFLTLAFGESGAGPEPVEPLAAKPASSNEAPKPEPAVRSRSALPMRKRPQNNVAASPAAPPAAAAAAAAVGGGVGGGAGASPAQDDLPEGDVVQVETKSRQPAPPFFLPSSNYPLYSPSNGDQAGKRPDAQPADNPLPSRKPPRRKIPFPQFDSKRPPLRPSGFNLNNNNKNNNNNGRNRPQGYQGYTLQEQQMLQQQKVLVQQPPQQQKVLVQQQPPLQPPPRPVNLGKLDVNDLTNSALVARDLIKQILVKLLVAAPQRSPFFREIMGEVMQRLASMRSAPETRLAFQPPYNADMHTPLADGQEE